MGRGREGTSMVINGMRSGSFQKMGPRNLGISGLKKIYKISKTNGENLKKHY